MDLSKHIYFVKVNLLVLLITLPYYLKSQISVNEYTQKLETYEFNDPNPIPTFITNPKIYPYFTFDGYSTKSVLKEFKVVELENKYIKVFILPEIGGKVWGAIDKISGEEFIYKNEVIKYRNISMRGPWTSGGIEFNFNSPTPNLKPEDATQVPPQQINTNVSPTVSTVNQNTVRRFNATGSNMGKHSALHYPSLG